MDQFSVGTRTDRCEERLSRAMALAVTRGDRVSIHSLRDRINTLRISAISRREQAAAARAFEAAVNGAAHDCAIYRLEDGDCEACWLASK